MTESSRHLWLVVDPVGDVTVVRFTLRELVKQGTVEAIGDKLTDLVETHGCKQLVLNFGTVEGVVSNLLGKLTGLQRKLEEAGGRLALCEIRPPLHEVLETLRLTDVFPIYGDEQQALQSFVTPG
jgi:anti-sigma B factor antagonist